MEESGLLSAQTGFDIAPAFSINELSKRQAEDLIPAGELFDAAMALVPPDSKLKPVAGKQLPELRENALARMHGMPPEKGVKTV